MPRSLLAYLDDLVTAADDIFAFTQDLDYPGYEMNRMVKAAVERKFEIIGEALAQMRQHYPALMQNVDEHRKIIDFRNYLIHQYSTVDNEAVWAAIRAKLYSFREQILELKAKVEAAPSS